MQLIVFSKASLVSGVLFSFAEGVLGVFACLKKHHAKMEFTPRR